MTKIPDLHYIVVRKPTAFARAGHATVFYRHDRFEKPYIYDVVVFYGENGVKTRAQARRYGRDIVMRKIRFDHYRSNYVLADMRDAVRRAGLDPEYRA